MKQLLLKSTAVLMTSALYITAAQAATTTTTTDCTQEYGKDGLTATCVSNPSGDTAQILYSDGSYILNDYMYAGKSIMSKTVLVFDNNNHQIGSYSYSGGTKLSTIHQYAWEDGLLTRHYRYTTSSGVTYEYTCLENSSSGKCSSYGDAVKVCDGNCSISYDSQGNKQMTYYDTTTGRNIISQENYDSDGNLAKKVAYDSNGNITGTETYAKIFTLAEAYAATSKGNHNTFSIRFK